MIEIRQSLVTIRYSETLILVDISRACCSAFKGIIQQRLEKSPAVMDGFEDGTTYQGISQVFLFFTRHDFPMKTHLLLFPMTQEIFGDVGVPWTGDYNGYGLDAAGCCSIFSEQGITRVRLVALLFKHILCFDICID